MRINIHPKFLGKQTEKFVKQNAPIILTAVGAAGVGVTAYFAGKGTVQAVRILDQEKFDRRTEQLKDGVNDPIVLTKKEISLKVWKLYIPAVGVGLVSIGAIFMANRINTKRLTAAVAAYTLVSQNHEEYKQKVIDLTSKSKEQRVRDELAKDRVANTPVNGWINTGYGNTKFMCGVTGRYFLCDMETIKKAANDVNYMMINSGLGEKSASLSDFYRRIGLPETGLSDKLGWNTDIPLELDMSGVLVEEDAKAVLGAPIGETVTFMSFIRGPFPDFA